MVVRKRRKKNKLRGNRFQGKGNTKNRRGGGRRGGKGRAGSHKHKFASYWMTFGMKKRLKANAKGIAMSLEQIAERVPNWVNEKKVSMEGKLAVIDGNLVGLDKVLGNGSIAMALKVKNARVSEKAKQKIEQAGGSVEMRERKAKPKIEPAPGISKELKKA